MRRVAALIAAVSLGSCGIPGAPSGSLEPLERMVDGADPGTLDWYLPRGTSPLAVLDRLKTSDLEPIRRAQLQRDLWMSFDTGVQREDRSEVRARIAGILLRLTLSVDEIARLPDTYAESAKLYPSSFDPAKREQPFLPPDLFDPNGPWVALHSDGAVAFRHDSFFGERSAFVIFVRHPEGREATIRFIEGLEKVKYPAIPIGMEFANVRRSLLISDQKIPVATPITESVQLRHYWGRNGDEQAVFKFELDRKDLRLRPLRKYEAKPSFAVSFEHAASRQSLSHPVLSTCLECHVGGAAGVQVFLNNDMVKYHLRPGTPEQEFAKVLRRKTGEDSWKALEQLWAR